MDLRSHSPYSIMKHGIINAYPSLNKSLKTEVAVMGAGITGALVAWHLCRAGVKVVMIDKRHVGTGSTAASTALLQYEIDTPLHKLIKLVGEEKAVSSYLLCRQSIYDLKKICDGLQKNAGFTLTPSLQYASFKKDVKDIEKEYALRSQVGFSLDLLDEKSIKNKFGFAAPAGLLSKDGAQVEAYEFTHELLKQSKKYGLKVYDNTEALKIIHHKKSVELFTDTGNIIKADKLVIACGYESQQYIPYKIEKLHSTYTLVSEPLGNRKLWYKNCLIWETAENYLYMRVTKDNRVLVGGKDDEFYNPEKRDRNIGAKSKILLDAFHNLFPAIKCRIDFQWAGTFGKTKDGLPYIGSIRQRPNTFFALGYGGNGITFSLIAAQIIRDAITGKKNENAGLFSFDR